jgi:hypothetical protein
MSALSFCQEAEQKLSGLNGIEFAHEFVELRYAFFHAHQNGTVFSTIFGADFFREIAKRLVNREPIKPDPGEQLGEYDANFNRWLKDQPLEPKPHE